MGETGAYHVALAIAFGLGAHALAQRLLLPSIVMLLATGVVIGPDVLGLFDPAVLGAARADIVKLAVAVILFEGGLGLRVEDLRQHQRSLVLLLTVGAAIAMLAGTLAARLLLGLSWPTAALYGAIVIVTGPTVVTPLLARLTVDRPARELLISEGVLIDPIGAIVAIVVAEYVVGRSAAWEAGSLIVSRLGLGTAFGVVGGVGVVFVLRRGLVPDELRNGVVLGAVLVASAAASRLSSEAGLMAAVAQGVVVGNAGLPGLRRLRQFKEELTTLLLSFLFVLLAANLPFSAVRSLGWQALAVVAVLMWVARPLAVFLCTIGSGLTLGQRAFVSWICPRGIVAAAVAGLFSIVLDDAGIPGGETLEALVFITIAVTVVVQGLTAWPMSRLFGVDAPLLQGTLIVGADQFGRLLARLLMDHGRQAVLMDLNAHHCRLALAAGLPVYEADALSIEALDEAGARYADTVLAVTRNAELNTLVAQQVRDNFRVERVLSLGSAMSDAAAEKLFPGSFPGIDEVNRELERGRARLVQYRVDAAEHVGRSVGELPYAMGEFAVLLQRRERTYIAADDHKLAADDRLWCLRTGPNGSPLEAVLTLVTEGAAESSRAAATTAGRP